MAYHLTGNPPILKITGLGFHTIYNNCSIYNFDVDSKMLIPEEK
jgi:hypothetical protein